MIARWMILLAALIVPSHAAAIDVEKLVMPGPLIQGHANVEAECSKCHTPFRSETQKELCIACHDVVGLDIQGSRGFHGRDPAAAKAACRDCHTDHEGRDADVVGLDAEAFDHDVTDFRLAGAHARVACEGCHVAPAKFREARHECIDCHADADVHQGRLGDRCADCHGERSWTEARFDHDATRFPLRGKHRDVACGLCHPGDRFKKTATDCQSCHGMNDVHLGRFGPDCGACHTVDAWGTARFDHDRDTKFPLRGEHRRTKCNACHQSSDPKAKLASECVSCHRADDEHRGRNGSECERCHGEKTWKTTTFDHDTATKFPLRGAHREIKCHACHRGSLQEEKLGSGCEGCHRDDDVHRGQEGPECGSCHGEEAWNARIFFDHDLTRFPLLGLHAVVACEQCHLTPRYKDAGSDCDACHKDDDVHRGNLGGACGQCHNPNGWSFWRFDHATQTRFPLRGAHERIDCRDCHLSGPERIALSLDCGGCHDKDDAHFGAFGRDCERCHGDQSWRDVKLIE